MKQPTMQFTWVSMGLTILTSLILGTYIGFRYINLGYFMLTRWVESLTLLGLAIAVFFALLHNFSIVRLAMIPKKETLKSAARPVIELLLFHVLQVALFSWDVISLTLATDPTKNLGLIIAFGALVLLAQIDVWVEYELFRDRVS